MKKLGILFIAGFIFAGCNPKESEEYISLQTEYDSLQLVSDKSDKTVLEYIKSMNEIQDNLDVIKDKEKIITVNSKDGQLENKDELKNKINDDIQLIYELMGKNKQTISRLEKELKNSKFRIGDLEKMLSRLSKEIETKDMEIQQLKEELGKLNIIIQDLTSTVDTLAIANEEKGKVIESQTEELNTAYYVFGTRKGLFEHKIITKEGGFIGLGKMEKLMADFDKEYFTKIDITKTTQIEVSGEKIRLLTSHPSSSFKWEKKDKVNTLNINNAKEFWGTSKYLVIIIDKN